MSHRRGGEIGKTHNISPGMRGSSQVKNKKARMKNDAEKSIHRYTYTHKRHITFLDCSDWVKKVVTH
jgi:hypothetical protein